MNDFLTFTNLSGHKISLLSYEIRYFEQREGINAAYTGYEGLCCAIKMSNESSFILVRESHDDILAKFEEPATSGSSSPVTSSSTTSEEVEPKEENNGNS